MYKQLQYWQNIAKQYPGRANHERAGSNPILPNEFFSGPLAYLDLILSVLAVTQKDRDSILAVRLLIVTQVCRALKVTGNGQRCNSSIVIFLAIHHVHSHFPPLVLMLPQLAKPCHHPLSPIMSPIMRPARARVQAMF